MLALLGRLTTWGPLFFGVLLFAPMLAAALDAAGILLGTSNLPPAMLLGAALGVIARYRGRWL